MLCCCKYFPRVITSSYAWIGIHMDELLLWSYYPPVPTALQGTFLKCFLLAHTTTHHNPTPLVSCLCLSPLYIHYILQPWKLGSMALWNVDIQTPHYTLQQPRKPWTLSSLPWKLHLASGTSMRRQQFTNKDSQVTLIPLFPTEVARSEYLPPIPTCDTSSRLRLPEGSTSIWALQAKWGLLPAFGNALTTGCQVIWHWLDPDQSHYLQEKFLCLLRQQDKALQQIPVTAWGPTTCPNLCQKQDGGEPQQHTTVWCHAFSPL
jgi:hypothetical protein